MELLVFLGYEAQELSTFAGAAAGVVCTVAILAVLGVALAPEFSSTWAERLGVAEEHRGPDPVDVIPGRGASPPATTDGDAADGATEPSPDATADAPSVSADPAE